MIFPLRVLLFRNSWKNFCNVWGVFGVWVFWVSSRGGGLLLGFVGSSMPKAGEVVL